MKVGDHIKDYNREALWAFAYCIECRRASGDIWAIPRCCAVEINE